MHIPFRLARDSVYAVALVVPLQGPAGIFGPSCELSAELAASEINAAGGVLGRELRLVTVDGGRSPDLVADEVDALITLGAVDAVAGWHISAVRRALAPRIAQRVPYVYTALYEGGERTPGVFVTGETPGRQLLPAMRVLREHAGVRGWFVVGNDYVWPRRTAVAARRYVAEFDGRITGEAFVPLGTEQFGHVLASIEKSTSDAVLMLLVGQDAVRFNRSFASAGLARQCLRLSTLMDENMLLASGVAGTEGLLATAGYFETLATPENLDFNRRYFQRFGVDAPPLGSLGESCYEGVRLLTALTHQAGSLDVRAMIELSSVAYEGPRGEVRLRGNHVDQRVYLASADTFAFDVVTQL